MVENHIHHHLQSLGMGLVHEFAVIIVRAKARVHLIVVGGGIAVVATVGDLARHIIFEHRRKPQCGHAQLVEIIDMLTNALQVAPMSQRRRRAVALLVEHTRHHIVGRIAIGKAVGHQHVEHIGIGKAPARLARQIALFQFIFQRLLIAGLFKLEIDGARFRLFHIQVNEQIVGAIEAHHAIHLHPGVGSGNIGMLHILAIHHDLERRVLHSGIPKGRFHMVDINGCTGCESNQQRND